MGNMKATVLAATKLLEHTKFVAETFRATGGNLSISKINAIAILKRVHELKIEADCPSWGVPEEDGDSFATDTEPRIRTVLTHVMQHGLKKEKKRSG